MSEYILEMRGITKRFSGNTVLNRVDFLLKPGEVHALIGENGAGKSTLMKILMGIHQKDEGSITVNGCQVQINNPKQALDHGIAMIHQELNPVLDMSITENIFLGKEKTIGKGKDGKGLVKKRAMNQETALYLKEVGLTLSPTTLMRSLSVAQMQMVEIVKAISWDAKIIIMDEPTSALTEREIRVLFEQICKLRENGVSVIFISHKLEEIFEIADQVTVLRDGKLVGVKPIDEITQNKLISMMVGREITEVFPKRDVPIGDVMFEAQDLCLPNNRISNISFKVRSGEILGIAGLVGAGRSELAEAIFGVRKRSCGKILIDGTECDIRSPKQAVAHKIAFVTEDRKVTGLNLIGSVRDNICIVSLQALTKHKLTNRRNEVKATDRFIQKLKIKTDSREKQTGKLSGGNQQKVVVSKWLLMEPDIIILDEPTRGIDVGAKRDIYMLMGDLVEQGKAIIMISSEMPEVMGMSDRIVVLAEGRVTGEIERKDFDQERIMQMQFAVSE